MKIGYACQNWKLPASTNNTFRLSSYSESKIIRTIEKNIQGLDEIIDFNVKNSLLCFRLGSGFIPFASHPVCKFDWSTHFLENFRDIGKKIMANKIRISMHPGQYVVLNSKKESVILSSIRELEYHAILLDLLNLNKNAKIQIHLGYPQGDKNKALDDFVNNYDRLSKAVRTRLVVENDDHFFSVKDCMAVHDRIKIPILLDTFHHSILNTDQTVADAFGIASSTWNNIDGIPMVDYSSQQEGHRIGKHAGKLNSEHFRKTMSELADFDFDLMLEIKDKEQSAIEALRLINSK